MNRPKPLLTSDGNFELAVIVQKDDHGCVMAVDGFRTMYPVKTAESIVECMNKGNDENEKYKSIKFSYDLLYTKSSADALISKLLYEKGIEINKLTSEISDLTNSLDKAIRGKQEEKNSLAYASRVFTENLFIKEKIIESLKQEKEQFFSDNELLKERNKELEKIINESDEKHAAKEKEKEIASSVKHAFQNSTLLLESKDSVKIESVCCCAPGEIGTVGSVGTIGSVIHSTSNEVENKPWTDQYWQKIKQNERDA